MAVVPEKQKHGVGTKLVEMGNDRLARNGCPCIVVVGHPKFYPRFGFRPGSRYGITCEWPVPDDVFMVLALDDTQMSRAVGAAVYRPEFSTVE
jgi:putative acetyltransferase